MKKIEPIEVTYCDHCKKRVDYATKCMRCGVEHCWTCKGRAGKSYNHGVHVSGSGDGYYCLKCDAALAADGGDAVYNSYRDIANLRRQLDDWSRDFRLRQVAAETRLREMQELGNG